MTSAMFPRRVAPRLGVEPQAELRACTAPGRSVQPSLHLFALGMLLRAAARVAPVQRVRRSVRSGNGARARAVLVPSAARPFGLGAGRGADSKSAQSEVRFLDSSLSAYLDAWSGGASRARVIGKGASVSQEHARVAQRKSGHVRVRGEA